ncbi:MAG TPA: serine hydrolase domain-containing protein [Thermomicrobiales bacterium]|nr:serine hydrolase domain-containing protein [Thermomicrobiales bacterium]
MTTTAPSGLAAHPDVASNIALMEVWLKARLAYDKGSPGVAVAIVHDQELVYASGFGYADVESGAPVTADSIFRIASHSKLFTAIAIMQLRDQRKLRLDAPIIDYLPWFRIQSDFVDTPPITIRHLLTHTSGLPREAGSPYWQEFNFPTADEVRERLPGQRAALPAETRWKYSNLALSLAGEIVTTVSGRPYARYVQQHILDPLGLASTSAVFPDAHRERLVTGYTRKLPGTPREPLPFIDAAGLAAATGFSSSVTDMARFIAWQFRLREQGGEEVLKASTLREMQRVHWLQPDWKSGWGIGFSIIHTEERDLIGHSGGYPGYLTNTRISPTEKVGVAVFTNSLDGEPQKLIERIFEWVAKPLVRAAAGESGTEPDPAWKQYEGTYRNLWNDSHVLPLDGKLAMVDPTLDNPKADYFTLEPVSEHTFLLEGSGSAALAEPVFFELGPDGVATRMKVGDNWSERVSYET